MSRPAAWWYLEYLSPARRARMLLALLPRYAVHFIRQPYRLQFSMLPPPGAGDRLQARHAAAALDVWIDQLLRAYSKLAGRPVRPGTGELAVHYIRLLAVFNREYEHRLAVGEPLALPDVISDPLVAARLAEWERYTLRHSQDEDVVRFLFGRDAATDYEKYLAVTTQACFSDDAEMQVESIRLDSGGYLVYLVRLIERFNGRKPIPELLDEYFQLGIVAKLADELADLATDHAEGRYNLLLALMAKYPPEQAIARERLDRSAPMPLTWWAEQMPQTFGEFCELFDDCYLSIQSKTLRQLGDVTMLRALSGPRKQQASRSAEHVTQRPAEPWR